MEKHITIGIAGHVDHGKTSLVRALTGIDTDRLQEEKRRGLSIDSGIAPVECSSGGRVALVDVPGHIQFLKNTVRGLCGVDAAVLVVAADDGVMPQTIEHMEVLRFLGAETGFVVLTKADLVDEETLELAELEIRELLGGTLLEESAVIPFSSVDRRGLAQVRDELDRLAERAPSRDPAAPFRCWIDRVKRFAGFGTVASGTVFSGVIRENDSVRILPSGVQTRARSLESHHVKRDRVGAGERLGISLHKVPIDQVDRGMLLSEPDAMMAGYLLNVQVRVLAGARGPLKNRQRVKLYLGTSVTNSMVVLMDRETLSPGEEGLAQIRTMRPLAALPQDRFVMSLLNVHSIIGGGTVLETPGEKFRKAKADWAIPALEALRDRDLSTYVGRLLKQGPNDRLLRAEELSRGTGFPLPDVEKEIKARLRKGDVLSFGGRGVFSHRRYRELKERALRTVKGLLQEDPLKKAVSPDEIRNRLSPTLDDLPFQRILSDLLGEEKLIGKYGGFSVPNRSVTLSEERERLITMLLDYARESGLTPISAGSFWKLHHGRYNKNELQRLLDHLHAEGRLIRLNNRRFMPPEAMEEVKRRVKACIDAKGALTIADCKEVLGYGRTVGVPVFEYLDAVGFTVRDGDRRTLRQGS